MKSLLTLYSNQRAHFSTVLENELRRLGACPSGDLRGNSTPEFDTTLSEEEVIQDCEQGEDRALCLYDEALASSLPGSLHALVERQYEAIKEAYSRIYALYRRSRAPLVCTA